MTVKLPGTYTGEQVVEAFKKACSFKDGGTNYSVEDDRVEYQYEPGSVRQTIKEAGARLMQTSSEWRKRFVFFGSPVEEIKLTYCAKLVPVRLGTTYHEVEVNAISNFGDDDFSYSILKPDSRYFNKPLMEKLIGNFYRELQSLPVSA